MIYFIFLFRLFFYRTLRKNRHCILICYIETVKHLLSLSSFLSVFLSLSIYLSFFIFFLSISIYLSIYLSISLTQTLSLILSLSSCLSLLLSLCFYPSLSLFLSSARFITLFSWLPSPNKHLISFFFSLGLHFEGSLSSFFK